MQRSDIEEARIKIMTELNRQFKDYQSKREKKLADDNDTKAIAVSIHQAFVGAILTKDYQLAKLILDSASSFGLNQELCQAFSIQEGPEGETLLHMLATLKNTQKLLQDCLNAIDVPDKKFINIPNVKGLTPLNIVLSYLAFSDDLSFTDLAKSIVLLQNRATLSGISLKNLKQLDQYFDRHCKLLMKKKELNTQEILILKYLILCYTLLIEKLPYLSSSEKDKRCFDLYKAAAVHITQPWWRAFKNIIDFATTFEQLKIEKPDDKNNIINYNQSMGIIIEKLLEEKTQNEFFNSLDHQTLLNLSQLILELKKPYTYKLPDYLSDTKQAAIKIAYVAYQKASNPTEKRQAKERIKNFLLLILSNEIELKSITESEKELLNSNYVDIFQLFIQLFVINYQENIRRAHQWLQVIKSAPQLFSNEAMVLMATPLKKHTQSLISYIQNLEDKADAKEISKHNEVHCLDEDEEISKNNEVQSLDEEEEISKNKGQSLGEDLEPTVRWANLVTALSPYHHLEPMVVAIDNHMIEFKDHNTIKNMEDFKKTVAQLNFQLLNHSELKFYKNELLILKKQIEEGAKVNEIQVRPFRKAS